METPSEEVIIRLDCITLKIFVCYEVLMDYVLCIMCHNGEIYNCSPRSSQGLVGH